MPQSFIINTGTGRDEDVLLATGCYDRVMADTTRWISGLPQPMRLHQEDFAQAMGVPASRKYEKRHEGYLKGMFNLLRKYSMKRIRFAPAYDLVSTDNQRTPVRVRPPAPKNLRLFHLCLDLECAS